MLGQKGPSSQDPLDAGHVNRVRAILSLGGVPPDDLEDGVQHVRLRLLERRFKDTEDLHDVGAWVSVVASRVAVDWYRSRRRQQRLSERLAAQLPHERSSGGGEEERVLSLTIAAGLEELQPTYRQVLALRFYADLSVPQIAQYLEIPEGTVKSRLYAATRALRRLLHSKEVIS